jgi:hypothetical protein
MGGWLACDRENGKVPESLNLPASRGLMPGIVASDEFNAKERSCIAACVAVES